MLLVSIPQPWDGIIIETSFKNGPQKCLCTLNDRVEHNTITAIINTPIFLTIFKNI
ncbi:hypothetical protein JCM19314_1784 [Nonlabens ulvanivorans]|uniref:Uncharacterized protein n=1 Tax=Nonlabens ulvanivorans TaxID=906888 RepID=A0A090QZ79_NONUL|nr:hypothetical protein JCM19314_1784 [Nonlabens ulvanivorans]